MIAEAQSTVFYGQEIQTLAIRPSSNYALPQPSLAPALASLLPCPTIADAIEALRVAKLAANRRENYVRELIACLKRFTRGWDDQPLTAITPEKVEAFF